MVIIDRMSEKPSNLPTITGEVSYSFTKHSTRNKPRPRLNTDSERYAKMNDKKGCFMDTSKSYKIFASIIRLYGAGNEVRTRDPNLGKVVLYH